MVDEAEAGCEHEWPRWHFPMEMTMDMMERFQEGRLPPSPKGSTMFRECPKCFKVEWK